jgi:hypothetical protein
MGLIGPACTPREGFSGRVLIGRGLTHPETPHQQASYEDTATQRFSHPLPGSRTPHHPPRKGTWEPGVPQCCGGHGGGETPGPIPNPEAKPASAEGTAGETRWESRTPPHNPSTTGPTPITGCRASGVSAHVRPAVWIDSRLSICMTPRRRWLQAAGGLEGEVRVGEGGREALGDRVDHVDAVAGQLRSGLTAAVER